MTSTIFFEFLTPSFLSEFGTDLFDKIPATSLTTSAFPCPPPTLCYGHHIWKLQKCRALPLPPVQQLRELLPSLLLRRCCSAVSNYVAVLSGVSAASGVRIKGKCRNDRSTRDNYNWKFCSIKAKRQNNQFKGPFNYDARTEGGRGLVTLGCITIFLLFQYIKFEQRVGAQRGRG